MVYRLWRRWCHGDFTTSQWEQLSYRLEKLRQFEDCRRFGLSVKASLMVSGEPRSTVYRWRRNYRREGLIGLLDESERVRRRRRAGFLRRRWCRAFLLCVVNVLGASGLSASGCAVRG